MLVNEAVHSMIFIGNAVGLSEEMNYRWVFKVGDGVKQTTEGVS